MGDAADKAGKLPTWGCPGCQELRQIVLLMLADGCAGWMKCNHSDRPGHYPCRKPGCWDDEKKNKTYCDEHIDAHGGRDIAREDSRAPGWRIIEAFLQRHGGHHG